MDCKRLLNKGHVLKVLSDMKAQGETAGNLCVSNIKKHVCETSVFLCFKVAEHHIIKEWVPAFITKRINSISSFNFSFLF